MYDDREGTYEDQTDQTFVTKNQLVIIRGPKSVLYTCLTGFISSLNTMMKPM